MSNNDLKLQKSNFVNLGKRIIITLLLSTIVWVEEIKAQSDPKPPYPIVFVHGWEGSDLTWKKTGSSWVSFFQNNFQWTDGGTLHVCLDKLTTTLHDEAQSDVEIVDYDGFVSNNDFYFINFDVKRQPHEQKKYLDNYFEISDIYTSSQNSFLVYSGDPTHFDIGDIIAVRNEYMRVTGVSGSQVTVERGIFGSNAVPHLANPINLIARNHSNLSNQASIVKGGLGLDAAINEILINHDANKVILVCHSMGGLNARQYIQSSSYSGNVAKLVTISTPHLGSNKSDHGWLNYFLSEPFDTRSDGCRDMRYNVDKGSYAPTTSDNAPFLFSEFEDVIWDNDFNWYSLDINGDGVESSDYVTGLNENTNWPSNLRLHCIIGKRNQTNSDDIVRCDRQFPWTSLIPDQVIDTTWRTFSISSEFPLHNVVHREHDLVMRGIDEPNTIDYAYTINPNNTYHGFTTFQENMGVTDYDWFKFESDVSGTVDVELTGCNPNYRVMEIWDENLVFVTGLSQNNPQSTVTINNVTEGELFYVWIDSHVYADSWENPYTLTISTTYIPDPCLTLGSVSPPSGTTDDSFEYSVFYTDPSNNPPNSVTIYANTSDFPMNAGGSNWEDGVEFTKTLTVSSPGIVEYYFEAETSIGETLRYPETGYLELNVIESIAGWEADVSSVNASPNYLENGGSFTVIAGVHNNSNSPDKIYTNLSYTFQLLSPAGNILETETGTIATINQLQTVNVSESFSIGSTTGSYRINFTISPLKDNNTSNNSGSDMVIVGQDGPSHQFFIASTESNVIMGNGGYPTNHPFMGDYYYITDITGSYVRIKQGSGGTPKKIYVSDFREYNSGEVALICEWVNTVGDTYAGISFGEQNVNYVEYTQTEITCYPGDEIIFEATCDDNEFTTDDPDFYDNSYIDDWFYDTDTNDDDDSAFYEFRIPNDASIGQHDFFMGCELDNLNEYFLRELVINVIAPPPNITSLSSGIFSADDIITISGSNFNTSGTVKFGTVVATTINSWTSTSISCVVPEGIQDANVMVTTSGGASNGMPYQVISNTGDPVVVQPVPDQSMDGGTTLLAADFNNVFWDPNGDNLTYDVQYSSSNLTHNPDFATTGLLYLTAENVSETIPITLNATDADNVTVNDVFEIQVTALPVFYSIYGNILESDNTPIDGVTVTFSNSGGSAITNASGYYTNTIDEGYTGVATPSKTGWTFVPTSLTYTNVSSNCPNQNYTGEPPINVPLTRIVQNETINSGQINCYNATNTITVAGSGTTVEIMSGAEATFIAGEKIIFEPGFSSHLGSYCNAYITLTGDYCSQQQSLNVEDVTINSMESECFDAINIITVAGSGTTVDIQSGGEATFIAGEKIIFETGFTSHLGSYCNAFITLTGDYCSQQPMMASSPNTLELEKNTVAVPEITVDDAEIKIYPNPTTGHFTIDFMGKETTANIRVMNFQGHEFYSTRCDSQTNKKVTIDNLPGGMYIIVIKTEVYVVTKKLIKLKL